MDEQDYLVLSQRCFFQARYKILSILSIHVNSGGYGFSMGAPTMLPHSVQEPS